MAKQLTRITGRIWVLGDDIDTDVIYPGKYLPIIDAEEMGKHAMEGVDPEFPNKLQDGDIIVAGMGFGCGSSREQAATCLKSAGVAAIIAGSFARIFFRNAVNQGLPLIQADITGKVIEGDNVTIDFGESRVEHSKERTQFKPLDDSVVALLEAGGLIPAVRHKLGLDG
jgi:3-isopropylmalate/(R)-2-methylmalate dehydratase small subunit